MAEAENRTDDFQDLFSRFSSLSIGVIGDFCLDAYWELADGTPELSLETGKATDAVRRQEYSPGGAGNVAANLAALGVGSVRAYGAMTDDLFGREVERLLRGLSVETGGFIRSSAGWQTPVYAKPYRGMEEQTRIDFGRFNALTDESAAGLVSLLESDLPALGGLIVNQQIADGVFSPSVVRGLNKLALRHPERVFLLDSRHRIQAFKGMICKLNAIEAASMFGETYSKNEDVPLLKIEVYCRALHANTGRPVIVTRSSHGIFASDGTSGDVLPALRAAGPVDPVGAGDTVVAALAAALAAGADLKRACGFAAAAAAVTIHKLRQTGTATPQEIQALLRQEIHADTDSSF